MERFNKDDIAKTALDYQTKSQESLDKALLTLCSAALALSITMYDKLYSGSGIPLLFLSWISFVTSVLSTLYSFTASKYLAELYLKWLHEGAVNGQKLHSMNNVTRLLNRLAIASFTIGIVSFTVFASVNVQERDMSDSKLSNVKLEERGLVMPEIMLPKKPPAAPTMPKPAKPVDSKK